MNGVFLVINICILGLAFASERAVAYGEGGYDSIYYYDPKAQLVLSEAKTKLIPVDRLQYFTTSNGGSPYRSYDFRLRLSDVTNNVSNRSVTLDNGGPAFEGEIRLYDLAIAEAANDPIHPGFFTAIIKKNSYLVHKDFDSSEWGDPIPLGEPSQPFCLLVVQVQGGKTPLFFGFSPNMNTLSDLESSTTQFCDD
jgi:hypothetical protein